MKEYVIIGNGIAAAGCIEGIRKIDQVNKIVVISKEKYPVYCRPLISYYLQGKVDLESMHYRSENFYTANGCEVLYGETAAKIDNQAKEVILSQGGALSYTSLCVATGARPYQPKIQGVEKVEKSFFFTNLDDALNLEKTVRKNDKVLIIGAGLIGLKCAEGLYGKVKDITVCDLAHNILASILDAETAPIVQNHLEQKGINFMLSDSVKEIKDNIAFSQKGKKIPFDILVIATGVKPNTQLLSEIDGEVRQGIIVDKTMKTSLDNIYAAGDCTEAYDITIDDNKVLALLFNAYCQGRTAGINMAGGNNIFDTTMAMNSAGFLGLHVMTAGSYITEADGGVIYKEIDSNSAKKFFTKDGILKGYILINKVEGGGIYTAMIREKTPLDTVDFQLLRENPSYLGFTPENRRKKFGGVV